MKISRREFVEMSMASAAGLCVGGYAINSNAAEPQTPLPEEDGYKLWLRYAPLGDAAKKYHKVMQQIRVDGTSATSGIIRDELRSATSAMLGGNVRSEEHTSELQSLRHLV